MKPSTTKMLLELTILIAEQEEIKSRSSVLLKQSQAVAGHHATLPTPTPDYLPADNVIKVYRPGPFFRRRSTD